VVLEPELTDIGSGSMGLVLCGRRSFWIRVGMT
jgi:hypothetical protein